MFEPTTFPLLTAIVLVVVAFIIFGTLAFSNRSALNTTTEFLFANRSLKRSRISNNLAATSVSLAGLLLFIFSQTAFFGWLMIVVLLFILAGQYLMIVLTNNVDPDPDQNGSIYRLLLHKTDSRRIAAWSNIIVVLIFFTILMIEIIIGASIFTYFAPQFDFAIYIGLFSISIIVVGYVLIGGFNVVSLSDTFQFWMFLVGLLLAFIVSILFFSVSEKSVTDLLANISTIQLPKTIAATFVLNIIVVNLTLPISQNSTWQRFASSSDRAQFVSGTKDGIWKVFVVVAAAIGIAVVILTTIGSVNSVNDIFDAVRNMGAIGNYFVFPLLFVGLVAALISTADSMLISLMLSLDDFRYRSGASDHSFLARYVGYGVAVMLLIFLIFLFHQMSLGFIRCRWVRPYTF